MANRIHRLAIPATGDRWDTARAHPAGAAVDYALFADRNARAKPAPPGQALSIDVAIPEGPVPPHYALAVDIIKLDAPGARRRRWPYRATAAALALHLLAPAIIILWPLLINLLWPLPPSSKRGLEDGVPETLNVGIISSADLERLSSDPLRRDGNRSPNKDETTPQEQPPARPPQQPGIKEASESGPQRAYDPTAFIEMASQQFSAQLDHAFKAAEARRDAQQRSAPQRSAQRSGSIEFSRPGATHVGKSDEFAKGVIWELNGHKPMWNGTWGITTVTFTVSATGHVEGLKLLKSSGDKWLDNSVLMTVQHIPMPAAPPGLPVGDRTFIINYIP